MTEKFLLLTILFAPLLGFIFNGLRFRSRNVIISGSVGTLAVATSFFSAVLFFFKLMALPAEGRRIHIELIKWVDVGAFSAPFGFTIDPVSIVMLLVITGVGTLIHLFSIGYMAHDERPTKYFAYLNLFIFNMLVLVLGDNLLVMFVGWEGVGLCSYLLIGFWFSDRAKAVAGMKAFITNRIGDAGFLLGIFLLFHLFGTVDFFNLQARLPESAEMTWGPITLACLFLFVGATGKSAQIPLYVWLPDAMAGPTPVSALIHAATMVTAGVYMIVRLSGLFMLAPNAMFVVALVGALTAVVAASIGLCQWDIKKVLAYSTVSQLGYMFLAVGVGAFGAALFHLMTHAFFKALMFLGSGSVIHGMHEEQDIRKMGGLKKHLPVTHWTFVMGWLAIIGTPLFSGFFSKDEILWWAFASPRGHWALWLVAAFGAGLTAFYMTRLMALTFWGKSRVASGVHPHESPLTMTLPLVVLAIFSVFGGWLGVPHVLGDLFGHMPNHLEHWLEGFVAQEALHGSRILEVALMTLSVAIAGGSASLAYYCYVLHPEVPTKIAKRLAWAHEAVANKYWVDEFYFSKIINPIVDLSNSLWLYFDVNIVDRATYWISDFVVSTARGLRGLQSGNLQQYAFYISFGFVGLLTYLLLAG